VVPQDLIVAHRDVGSAFHIKERDLKNRLGNEDIPAEELTPPEKEGGDAAEEGGSDGERRDYQLQRAIDLLKSITIFQRAQAADGT
jgi:hypothetical protein